MAFFSRFFGRDEDDALSIPPMDGVFKPNKLLDTAERVVEVRGADNLAVMLDTLYCSSGNELHRIDLATGTSTEIRTFDGAITAIASTVAGDRLVVAIEIVGLEMVDPDGFGQRINIPAEFTACITALLFRDEDTLEFAVGSRRHALSEWKRDLMSHGKTGLIARHSISTGKTEILFENMAFPYGLALRNNGSLIVTEAWRHRLVSVPSSSDRSSDLLLSELPAYPARLVAASQGGYWLALFAPRRQLTELVLLEDDYRLEMMATIPSTDWIGPDFGDSGSENQPLQSGSVRQMGIMKPWAPSRSYGMVVRLDEHLTPVASYHSRADGNVHGIASIVELGGHLYAASRGAEALIRLHLASEGSI